MKTKGEEVFEKVRDFLDNEARDLSRAEYREVLERMADQVQCYIDCWDQEEKNERADAPGHGDAADAS